MITAVQYDEDDVRISRRALLLGGVSIAAAAVGAAAAVEWDSPTFRRVRGACGDTPPLPASRYRVTSGRFASDAMRGSMPWLVALPDDHDPDNETLPLVLCLHGAFVNADRVVAGVGFPAFASQAGLRLALAAPGGGGTLYWHPRADGRDPLGWALDEFLPMVEARFRVGGSRQRRGAIGWSMGGHGALLVAQERRDLASAAVALSPAVWPSYDAALSGHDYTYDSATDWQRYGVFQRLDELDGVAVRVDCGDADPFAPTARQLLARIPGVVGGIEEGCHDDGFWRRRTPTALRFLAEHLQT